MTTESQKKASKKYYQKNNEAIRKNIKKYYEEHKEHFAKYSRTYYQKNKRRLSDLKIQARLIEKIRKPYHLKCKGVLFCNDLHLIRQKRKTQLNEIDDGQEHNFNELYKMIFKRDLKWKE